MQVASGGNESNAAIAKANAEARMSVLECLLGATSGGISAAHMIELLH